MHQLVETDVGHILETEFSVIETEIGHGKFLFHESISGNKFLFHGSPGGAAGGAATDPGQAGTMLVRGARCEITGLVAEPQSNGTRCTVTEFSAARGRWEVQHDDGRKLGLLPANLIAIGAPTSGCLSHALNTAARYPL